MVAERKELTGPQHFLIAEQSRKKILHTSYNISLGKGVWALDLTFKF